MKVRPLRRIVSFQLALVAVIPFLVVGALGAHWLLPELRSEIETRQHQFANAIASQVQNYLTSAQTDLESMASTATDEHLKWYEIEHLLQAQINRSTALRVFYIVGPDGHVKAAWLPDHSSSHQQDLTGVDLSHTNLFREVSKSGRPVWSDTFMSVVGGGLSVAFAMPAGDMVIAGEVALEKLMGFLQRISDNRDQLIFIIDRQGQVVVDQDGRYTAQQLNIGNIPLIREALAAEAVHSGKFDFQGRTMLGTMIDIPSSNWKVLLAWPMDMAFHLLATITRITVLGLIAAVLLSLGAAFFMTRRWAMRFIGLADHARHIAKGEDAPAWQGERVKEFEQLADDLHLMAGAIREREWQLLREKQFGDTIIENIPGMFYLIDEDLKLKRYNRNYQFLSGYSAEELANLSIAEIVAENDRAFVSQQIAELFAKGGCKTFEIGTVSKSGVNRTLFVTGILWEIEKTKYILAMGIDITERKEAEQKTRRHLDNLAALRTIDTAINSSLDLRGTLNVLLQQTVTQLKIDAACLLLYKEPTRMFEYAAGKGFFTERIAAARVRMGESYAGRLALERKTRFIPNIAVDVSPMPETLMKMEDFRSYVGVPLIAKGQVKGVLEIFHRKPLAPDQEWLDFVEALAGQAAIAVDNAELFQHLQQKTTEILISYDHTIEGWATALDFRDKETEGHSRRVTEITERLARTLGVADAELVHLRRGALLHDIGKLGVPDSILLKPSSLNDEEREAMEKHPEIAFKLLAPIPFLRPAIDIPYCHHEKWDGTGYPRGLKGEEIPYSARIFAIVDVWDALLYNRPYRPAWPEEKVREHIRSLSGSHFEPAIVEAFLAISETIDDKIGAKSPNLSLLNLSEPKSSSLLHHP